MEYVYIALGIIIIVLLIILLTKKPKESQVIVNDEENKYRFDKIDKGITDQKEDLVQKLNDQQLDLVQRLSNQNTELAQKLNDQKAELTQKLNTQNVELTQKLNTQNTELAQKLSEQNVKLIKEVNDLTANINKIVTEKLETNNKYNKDEFEKIITQTEALKASAEQLKSFSTKVEDLEKILADNKTKGAFGEYQLEQVLMNTFSDDRKLFDTQYTLTHKGKDGSALKPDSVIFLNDQVLCIDSKFPLDAYKAYISNEDKSLEESILCRFAKDVKDRMDEVKKYIVEGETTPYACMFIPSDGIVSLIHTKCYSLVEKAQKDNVLILSPTTIVPFISSLKIVKADIERSERIEEITKSLVALGDEFKRFAERWDKVKKQIDTVHKSSDEMDTTVTKITRKFNNIKNADIEEDNEDETN